MEVDAMPNVIDLFQVCRLREDPFRTVVNLLGPYSDSLQVACTVVHLPEPPSAQ